MICNNFASQSCSSAGAPFFFFFLLRLCRRWQNPNRLHNYAVQVQSARKSNCNGCLELPETVWKLRAELSEAPKGPTGLYVCAPAKRTKTVCLSFHFACAADSMRVARASVHRHPECSSAHFFRLSIDNCIRPTCWLRDSDSCVPGTCQRHHTCPQDPGSVSMLGQQHCDKLLVTVASPLLEGQTMKATGSWNKENQTNWE